jgi:hypothetical protein
MVVASRARDAPNQKTQGDAPEGEQRHFEINRGSPAETRTCSLHAVDDIFCARMFRGLGVESDVGRPPQNLLRGVESVESWSFGWRLTGGMMGARWSYVTPPEGDAKPVTVVDSPALVLPLPTVALSEPEPTGRTPRRRRYQRYVNGRRESSPGSLKAHSARS